MKPKSKYILWALFGVGIMLGQTLIIIYLGESLRSINPAKVWDEGYRSGASNVTATARDQVAAMKRGTLISERALQQLFLDGMTNNPYGRKNPTGR